MIESKKGDLSQTALQQAFEAYNTKYPWQHMDKCHYCDSDNFDYFIKQGLGVAENEPSEIGFFLSKIIEGPFEIILELHIIFE